jgi:homoserine kinase
MEEKKITVHIPATIANLVCGFDILGVALQAPYDVVDLTINNSGKVTLKHTDEFNLPEEPTRNVAGVSLLALMQAYTETIGFDVVINKQIKPGSGLGSSAASSAGVVVAANKLLNNYFTNEQLVTFAMEGEKLASGVAHADNIAPCVFGGATLIRSSNPLDIIPINTPTLFVTVVHPQIEVKTSDARQILKKEVSLKSAIQQWGNIAGLITGFFKNDYELIGRSLEDVIIEPVRSILIPGFNEVKANCKAVGALGGGISGSGPSIFMFSKTLPIAEAVELEMKKIYDNINIKYYTYVTQINQQGIQLIS